MSFLGQDGFYWGIGVVEDRFDPEKLNRVRVRWLGIHDEDKEKILTKDLPWAQVMQPTTGNAMAGVGDTGNSLIEGTWVVGFANDPSSLQEWVVMGTLPGDNTTTALQGESNKKWAKYRGNLKEYNKSTITEEGERGQKAVPLEDYLVNKFADYEKGFHDPTVDLRNIPYPPSDVTIGNTQQPGHKAPLSSFFPIHENALAKPGAYYPIHGYVPDPKYIFTPRIPNYKPAGRAPNDLDACDDEKWAPTKPAPTKLIGDFTRLTHSDILHYLYRTTRRVTVDLRQCGWETFGTFAWPDVCTYGNREHFGGNLSTGYLENNYWRENREAGSAPGGTHAPTWPITRDTPTASKDSASITGIDPLDNRASWGKASGDETGYFLLDGEEYRVTHPRTKYVQKGKIGPTLRQEVEDLFNAGQYGTGIYNISNPDKAEARKDIKWKDVKNSDLVVLPEKDTNRLAEGGIPIANIVDNIVTTKSSLFGDSTKYFAQPKESRGKNPKPLIQKGDVISISGVRGAEEYNGRIYRVMAVSDNKTSFDITIGTQDGVPWTGPGSISYASPTSKSPSTIGATGLNKKFTDEYSAYLGGGIVSINPHWIIRAKAETRERQINVGNPEMNTGINMRFWNQPTSRWAAQYPYNHVYETESGHIKEFDDTPGAERIHEAHRSGTYYEIDHHGTKVDYVKGDNYNVRIFDDYLYVKGKVAWTMDDAVWIRCNDRLDLSAKWKIQIHSGGDLDLSSKRNINMKAAGDINMQYDGHMNILGTALDPEAAKYHAGTRPCDVLSFFNVKAGHMQTEMMEDIKMQTNKNSIALKSLSDNIYLSAGGDFEFYAFGDSYKEANRIYERSMGTNNRTSYTGSIVDVSIGGSIDHYALGGDITAEALAGNLKFNANAGKVRISALDSTVEIFAGYKIGLTSGLANIDLNAGTKINATAKSEMHLRARTGMYIDSQTQMHLESLTAMFIESNTDLNILGDDDVNIRALTNNLNLMGYVDVRIESETEDVNILAADNIIETGDEIHMNGPTADFADEAAIATGAIDSVMVKALAPTAKEPAIPAYIAPTIDIMLIDLPDPAPADGMGLGINANDPGTPGSGYGGENIRALHDTITDIIAGNSNTSW